MSTNQPAHRPREIALPTTREMRAVYGAFVAIGAFTLFALISLCILIYETWQFLASMPASATVAILGSLVAGIGTVVALRARWKSQAPQKNQDRLTLLRNSAHVQRKRTTAADQTGLMVFMMLSVAGLIFFAIIAVGDIVLPNLAFLSSTAVPAEHAAWANAGCGVIVIALGIAWLLIRKSQQDMGLPVRWYGNRYIACSVTWCLIPVMMNGLSVAFAWLNMPMFSALAFFLRFPAMIIIPVAGLFAWAIILPVIQLLMLWPLQALRKRWAKH